MVKGMSVKGISWDELESASTRPCATCGAQCDLGKKYCSRDCAPYGHFLDGERQKGPIEYLSRASLEIEKLQAKVARLEAKLKGKAYRPEPNYAPREDYLWRPPGERKKVWVATRPRFHRVKKETLEEKTARILEEVRLLKTK